GDEGGLARADRPADAHPQGPPARWQRLMRVAVRMWVLVLVGMKVRKQRAAPPSSREPRRRCPATVLTRPEGRRRDLERTWWPDPPCGRSRRPGRPAPRVRRTGRARAVVPLRSRAPRPPRGTRPWPRRRA